MEYPIAPKIDLEKQLEAMEPEVKAFIYQTIIEFEPFITPSTLISVIAKDPKKSTKGGQKKSENQTWRISISLSEDGTTLEEEASDDNIFSAITQAKDKLVKVLGEIQDSVISNQDRTAQINHIRDSGTVH
jgi:ribosome-associated translation inhibitor RaiA